MDIKGNWTVLIDGDPVFQGGSSWMAWPLFTEGVKVHASAGLETHWQIFEGDVLRASNRPPVSGLSG